MEEEQLMEATCLGLGPSTGLCPPQGQGLFLINTKMQHMQANSPRLFSLCHQVFVRQLMEVVPFFL